MNKIFWFTGQSGAGKTTVAREVQKNLRYIGATDWPVLLDGDEMRGSISLNAGFSRDDRREHNLRVARLAKVLVVQTNVFVSVIAPMGDVRREISDICDPVWIYVKRTLPERPGHFYEEPNDYFTVDHDVLSVEESAHRIMEKVISEITKN